MSLGVRKRINAELDTMLELEAVEKSNSPCSRPILLVRKNNGKVRFCVDFRKLNAVTKEAAYPLPYVFIID